MRIKSRWFKPAKAHSPEQNAGVMAFIIWRAAQNTVKCMRADRFDIDAGAQFFDFIAEFLVFMVIVADRIAYQRLDEAQRNAFSTALAIRVAQILADNEIDLLGIRSAGSCESRFVALFNLRSGDYATFGFDDTGPDFAFLRYLGNHVLEIMPKKDQSWVVDQVMEIEAPAAVEIVRRGMDGVFDRGSGRPARHAAAMGE